MALTASVKIAMGTSMPPFVLADPQGQSHQSDMLIGPKGLLVIFTCHHCPYAKSAWPRLIRLAQHAKSLKINTVAINPNTHFSGDGQKEMVKKIKELQIDFPYLMDETQSVAKSFQAQCTPDIFLYDQERKLVYHGRIDDSWEDESKATSLSLRSAIDALAEGKPVERRQISSVGCSIKWRKSK